MFSFIEIYVVTFRNIYRYVHICGLVYTHIPLLSPLREPRLNDATAAMSTPESRSLFPIPFFKERKQSSLKKSSTLRMRQEIYNMSLEHYTVSKKKEVLRNKSYSAQGMSKELRKQLKCSQWPNLEQLSNKINSTKL